MRARGPRKNEGHSAFIFSGRKGGIKSDIYNTTKPGHGLSLLDFFLVIFSV
jgi:hypothetical protein